MCEGVEKMLLLIKAKKGFFSIDNASGGSIRWMW